MHPLPTDLGALLALAFVLGLRHGVDADHLAAIDGLTRANTARGRVGWWFSAGHGAVVALVALGVAAWQAQWATPAWLGPVGAWTSVALLLALGVMNLRALRATPAATAPVGLRSRWVARATQAHGAAAVGALFALSFDTLALAALFGGSGHALAAAGAFVLGMALVDGFNGWFVAQLLRRADARSLGWSRALGWAIVVLSLGLAAWAIAALTQPLLAAIALLACLSLALAPARPAPARTS